MKYHFKKSILTLGLTLTASSAALADTDAGGLFVEPMVTYERGQVEVDLPSPFSTSDSTVNGFGVGARLGFHVYESVFLGVDGRYSRPTYKNNDTEVDSPANSYNLGPVLGAQMPTPFGIRVWAGYIIEGEMDVEEDRGVDFEFKDGTGFRVGAGIKLTMVSVNLEYQKIDYDETELSDAGVFTGTTSDVEQTNKSMVLSVSFPIAL